MRVLRVLREVDLIAAEDTRVTKKLLNHYQVTTSLTSYHEHNKRIKGPELIKLLIAGQNIALVSDAGLPGIADPGADLVVLAVNDRIKVVPLPGANAALGALIISGFATDRFVFEAFLSRKNRERRAKLAALAGEDRTVIFYEAPHRLLATLQDLAEALPGRRVAVVRELTKIYEETVRGTAQEVLHHFEDHHPRGEITLLVEGVKELPKAEVNLCPEAIAAAVDELIKKGLTSKDAIKKTSLELGIPKRDVYQAVLEQKQDE